MNEDNQISFKLPFYEQMQQNFQKMQEVKPKQQRKKLAIEIARDKQIQEELDRQIAEAQDVYQGTPIIEVNKPEATISKADKVSAPVRAINNYVNRAKYKIQHGEPLGGEYTLPTIGLTALGVGATTSAPFLTTGAIAGGIAGEKVIDYGTKLATGKKWAEWMSDKTGLVPEAASILHPGMLAGGYYIPKYGADVARRVVETAMRTSPIQNGLKSVLNSVREFKASKDYQRMKAIGKYILTGKPTGNKGYYNSLRFARPEEDYYSGFDWIPEHLRGKNDIIDAFLYGKEVDPGFGLYKQSVGKDFGEHTDYIYKKYPMKAKKIQVYGTSKSDPLKQKVKTYGSQGIDSEIDTSENIGFDAAGHRLLHGVDEVGNSYTMEQDIWKFQPKEYMKKWIDNHQDAKLSLWEKALMRTGLEVVDRTGTPVIVRTPWRFTSAPSSEIKINMNNLLKSIDLNNLIQPK